MSSNTLGVFEVDRLNRSVRCAVQDEAVAVGSTNNTRLSCTTYEIHNINNMSKHRNST